jgi:hypothetical protein
VTERRPTQAPAWVSALAVALYYVSIWAWPVLLAVGVVTLAVLGGSW